MKQIVTIVPTTHHSSASLRYPVRWPLDLIQSRPTRQFLRGHNVMDYSLLVGVFRQQHVPSARREFRNIVFVAVIDILQVYTLHEWVHEGSRPVRLETRGRGTRKSFNWTVEHIWDDTPRVIGLQHAQENGESLQNKYFADNEKSRRGSARVT